MPAERFYIPHDCTPHQNILIDDQEFHHLVHVMRVKPGEEISVVNGKGVLATAVVKSIGKRQAELEILECNIAKPPAVEIILAQAIPRINRLDFIIEKATELGVTQFWLFPGKLSERKALSESQLERVKSLSIAAMKQCGRLFLPKVVIKPALHLWEAPSCTSYYGDPEATVNFASICTQLPLEKDIVFFVGPEAGFSNDEEETLVKLQAQGVRLHANVLRTDTAPLVALSLITTRF